MDIATLLDRLVLTHKLSVPEWLRLLEAQDQSFDLVRKLSQATAQKHFGSSIYYRGIVEFTNYCRNNCLYCGLRKANQTITRYRLEFEEIMACCAKGYELGVKTFVLQGGEDPDLSEAWLIELVQKLSLAFPEACITLSLGELSQESYAKLYQAGARRYLLRHETASPSHYAKLHPPSQSFWHRINCLYTLKHLGYQTGCGMMIGSPSQTLYELALDLAFIQEFKPEMLGIGPFLPQHATPFKNFPPGSAKLTLYVLALCRLMLPLVLMPATTALQTLLPHGYKEGILSGCNVIMPNLTFKEARSNYQLYDHKPVEPELSQTLNFAAKELETLGYELKSARGDFSAELR